jgi:chromosome partitioning protein
VPGVLPLLRSKMDNVDVYRRIASVLRSAQRAAIESEDAPDKRKRLRTISSQEVAAMLEVKQQVVTASIKSADDRRSVGRNRLAQLPQLTPGSV